jgi:hypothetical protein
MTTANSHGDSAVDMKSQVTSACNLSWIFKKRGYLNHQTMTKSPQARTEEPGHDVPIGRHEGQRGCLRGLIG